MRRRFRRSSTATSWDRAVGIRWRDLMRTGIGGLGARPVRALLTGAGVAIGIASMVTVVGISSSSKAGLLAELDALGTNLLQVKPGETMDGKKAELPTDAPAMIDAVPTVLSSAAITTLDKASPERNPYDDSPYGLSTVATDGAITDSLGLHATEGRLIDANTQQLPVAVLGSVASERLGITSLTGGPTVSLRGQTFQIIGIMAHHPLHPDLDRSVLIGRAYAIAEMDASKSASSIYVLVVPPQVEATRPALARVANPGAPNEVAVSRPSDALAAQAAVDRRLQNLLLALGATALLVGGVGIANVMVVAVLERRAEVGLRRALGATKTQIGTQFVVESAAVAALGGGVGTAIGLFATVGYATSQGWKIAVPWSSVATGVLIALAVGALAGLYPAVKAARLDPADAVRLNG